MAAPSSSTPKRGAPSAAVPNPKIVIEEKFRKYIVIAIPLVFSFSVRSLDPFLVLSYSLPLKLGSKSEL